MTSEPYIPIKTAAEIGALLRDRRKALGMDQAELARRIGVSRQWVIGVEKGRPRAELGLVLRALDEVGLRLAGLPKHHRSADFVVESGVDIDAVLSDARKPRS